MTTSSKAAPTRRTPAQIAADAHAAHRASVVKQLTAAEDGAARATAQAAAAREDADRYAGHARIYTEAAAAHRAKLAAMDAAAALLAEGA